MDELIEAGKELLVEHIISRHPDITKEHLLHHSLPLPTCAACYSKHDEIMAANESAELN